jgi:hypothetical protein
MIFGKDEGLVAEIEINLAVLGVRGIRTSPNHRAARSFRIS